MARLILIRHGESLANAERRFTHGPHEALSRRGRDEALERGRSVAARFDPVAIYASPFVRALERIGKRSGLPSTTSDNNQSDKYPPGENLPPMAALSDAKNHHG